MKTAEEFKNRFNDDSEFIKLFISASSPQDTIKIAHYQGYDVSLKEIRKQELSDNVRKNISGGNSKNMKAEFYFYIK